MMMENQHKSSKCRLCTRIEKLSKKGVTKNNPEGRPIIPSNTRREGDNDIICSICMESPHNAVLLLCSSHSKGCRPYMCATTYHDANCLERYKKAFPDIMDLSCPLCRGHLSGWIVDAPARRACNARKRSCMQGNCPFTGAYRELKEHMRKAHPGAVDPFMEKNRQIIEDEIDFDDTMRAFVLSMMGNHDSNYDDSGSAGVVEPRNYALPSIQEFDIPGDASLDSRLRRLWASANGGSSGIERTRNGRIVLGRSGRRARRRGSQN